MTAEEVLEVIDRLDGAGVETWIDGGWGVDALVGRQTRPHADLDFVVSRDDDGVAAAALAAIDLVHDAARSLPPATRVLSRARGAVDMHLVVRDARGNGWQRLGERSWGLYPASGFEGRGEIGGRAVRCVTADVQVRHHLGYELGGADLHDLRLLAERFDVAVPPLA